MRALAPTSPAGLLSSLPASTASPGAGVSARLPLGPSLLLLVRPEPNAALHARHALRIETRNLRQRPRIGQRGREDPQPARADRGAGPEVDRPEAELAECGERGRDEHARRFQVR